MMQPMRRHRSRSTADTASTRRIRSFVLRQGRFTPAQQRAFEQHWPRFGLDHRRAAPTGTRRSDAMRRACSKSASATASSCCGRRSTNRTRDFIGIEVHGPGVGRLMNALAAHNIDNVRLYNHDAVDVLERVIARASLDEVRIYFPGPWPKKRQQKRRLVQPEFVALVASRVKPGGKLASGHRLAGLRRAHARRARRGRGWRNLAGARTFLARGRRTASKRISRSAARDSATASWDLVYERT